MRTIVLLEGSERLDRGSIAAVAGADLVVAPDGEVIKGPDDGPARINLAELTRVLSTNARPRKAAGGGGDTDGGE